MAGSASGGVLLLFGLAVIVLMVASYWKVFTKANQPGWAALIPIYNLYVMLKIGDNPGWYLLLFFVPLANIWVAWKMHHGIAEAFGKGAGFALGLWFVAIVFFPLLAFGDATYRGPNRGRPGSQATF